jgi:hypothetical protein
MLTGGNMNEVKSNRLPDDTRPLRDQILKFCQEQGYDVYSKYDGRKESDFMVHTPKGRFHIVVWDSDYADKIREHYPREE